MNRKKYKTYRETGHFCRECMTPILQLTNTGPSGGGNGYYTCLHCGTGESGLGPSGICLCDFDSNPIVACERPKTWPRVNGIQKAKGEWRMSDTPRTDVMVTGNSDPCPDEYEDLASFCRQLERENADLLAACEQALEDYHGQEPPTQLIEAIKKAKGGGDE